MKRLLPIVFLLCATQVLAQSWPSRPVRVVVLDLENVPAIDATGLVALGSLVARLNESGVKVILVGLEGQPLRALARAGWRNRKGRLRIFRSFERGIAAARAYLATAEAPPAAASGGPVVSDDGTPPG